jgi:hypothetical protein
MNIPDMLECRVLDGDRELARGELWLDEVKGTPLHLARYRITTPLRIRVEGHHPSHGIAREVACHHEGREVYRAPLMRERIVYGGDLLTELALNIPLGKLRSPS